MFLSRVGVWVISFHICVRGGLLGVHVKVRWVARLNLTGTKYLLSVNPNTNRFPISFHNLTLSFMCSTLILWDYYIQFQRSISTISHVEFRNASLVPVAD